MVSSPRTGRGVVVWAAFSEDNRPAPVARVDRNVFPSDFFVGPTEDATAEVSPTVVGKGVYHWGTGENCTFASLPSRGGCSERGSEVDSEEHVGNDLHGDPCGAGILAGERGGGSR